MARNKISDLRDHLFAALERIDNDELTNEELQKSSRKPMQLLSLELSSSTQQG